MNCPTVDELLPLHAYGDLSADEAAEVDGHLAECPGCRAEFAALTAVRQALDATPPPEVVVDPIVISHAAIERSAVRGRWRWAVACGGLALGLMGLALLKLEVRVDGQQCVVRWGTPPEIVPPARLVESAPDTMVALEERVRVLQELTHALAADVAARDRVRGVSQVQTNARLDALVRTIARRFQEAERDVDALYTAQFRPVNEGVKP